MTKSNTVTMGLLSLRTLVARIAYKAGPVGGSDHSGWQWRMTYILSTFA